MNRKHTPIPELRPAATPARSVSQHPAATDEATGVAVAGCGRTAPATRCVFRRARATAGLYGSEETARRSSEPPTEDKLVLLRP